MAMRNYWITLDADGTVPKGFGPNTARGAGFDLAIRQRVDGESVEVLTITGRSDGEELCLRVSDRQGNVLHTIRTKR